MHRANDSIWALTTFYNPARYERRLRNFHAFRQRLSVPLVAVELSYDGHFELGRNDADMLVRVNGGAVLWQKERLLNIAISHVPSGVRNVAWLDADVILEDREWPAHTCAALQRAPLVQLFDQLVDLDPAQSSCDVDAKGVVRGNSIASLVLSGTATLDDFRPNTTPGFRRCLCGLAWAARRELLDTHGFYDAMIIGSGDRAMACAALGRFDDAISAARLNNARASHYMQWAQPFHASVQGQIECNRGRLFHLWHGDIAHRRYVERHREFAEFAFDPTADVRIGSNGSWEWASDKPVMHAYLARYFADRQEDGLPVACASGSTD